ncbi:MAG TPA: glycosyltransferase family 39 protein [bacterium]|nr:glycosyltransferase family 39 protein [bacterium]
MNGVRRPLIVILLVGLVVRLGALWLVLPTKPLLDERDYYFRAAHLAEDKAILAEGKRAPASIWYYAAFLKTFGAEPTVARVANVLASWAAIPIVWGLGRRFGGDRVGLAAALGVALYPNLVFFSFSLWSESLYLPLALGSVLLLAEDRPPPARSLLAGMLMGGAALTREVGVVLPVIGGLWILGRSHFRGARAFAGAVLLGVGFAAVVLPWSLRQNRHSDSFALVTHTRWMNLYLGNVRFPETKTRTESMPPWDRYERLGKSLAEREAAARPLARQAIVDRMPWWPLEKTAETLPRLLTPNSFPVARWLARPDEKGWRGARAYRARIDGTPLERLRPVFAYAAVGAWIVVLPAGLVGIVLAWRRPLSRLFVLYLALHVLPVIVTFGMSRFRLPLVPILVIAAASLFGSVRTSWAEAGAVRRSVASASALAAAIVVATQWKTILVPWWG